MAKRFKTRRKKNHRAEARPLHRARRVGIEAFLVEEEDAGAEGEEHDCDAGGDAEAGSHGCGTFVTATDDDVARDDDKEFQDTALEQPGSDAGDGLAGIPEVQIKDDSPDHPKGAPEKQEIGFLFKERFPKIVAANRETQGPNHRGRKKSREKRADGDRNENVRTGLETFLGGVDG